MKEVRLTDLDELALKVRDRVARSYILEAIDTYRQGTYRSSIVSTWIAVTFDIISKIRELATQGDPMAKAFVSELDQAIATKNIKQLQKLEDGLLEKATAEFEFLSAHEQADFSRLKDDRNLCAHPAYVAEELLFEPEPERVRMHIVHAVKHLLQHRPVQGKSAIERIVRDIKSASFPSTLDTAYVFLNARYLDRAKKTLIENLIFLLLKALLRGDVPDLPLNYSGQMLVTLQVIAKRYPDIYEERMRAKLLTIVESLEDDRLPNVFQLLGADPYCWRWLDEPTKVHLKAVIQANFSQPNIRNSILKALAVEELKPITAEALEKLPPETQIDIISSTLEPTFIPQAIALYSDASSYQSAQSLGRLLILPMTSYFSIADVQKILGAVEENRQIREASRTPEIIEKLYEQTKHYLPYIHESWRTLFNFLASDYARWQLKEKGLEILIGTNWKNLVKRLEEDSIIVLPTNE